MNSRQIRFAPLLLSIGLGMSGCARMGNFIPWTAKTDDPSAASQSLVNHRTSDRGNPIGRNPPESKGLAFKNWGKKSPQFESTNQRMGERRDVNADEQLRSHFAVARLAEKRGEYEKAKSMYQSLLKRQHEQQPIIHRLGVIAAREGRFEDANQLFDSALRSGPANPEILTDQGYCYYIQGDLPAAERSLRDAVAMQPRHPRANNNLAVVVGLQGRFDESLSLFRRISDLPEAYANLAYVYTQRGMLDEAFETYNKALTMDNSLEVAAEAWLQVAELRKQRNKAAAENELADDVAVNSRPNESPQQPRGTDFARLPTVNADESQPRADFNASDFVEPVTNVRQVSAIRERGAGNPNARAAVLEAPADQSFPSNPQQSFEVVRGPIPQSTAVSKLAPVVTAGEASRPDPRPQPAGNPAHETSHPVGAKKNSQSAAVETANQLHNRPIMQGLPNPWAHGSMPVQIFPHRRPSWTPSAAGQPVIPPEFPQASN